MSDTQAHTYVVDAHTLEIQALRNAIAEAAINAQYWNERWQEETKDYLARIVKLSNDHKREKDRADKLEQEKAKMAADAKEAAATIKAQAAEITKTRAIREGADQIANLKQTAVTLLKDLDAERRELSMAREKLAALEPENKRIQDLYKELAQYRIDLSSCSADLRSTALRAKSLEEAIFTAINNATALQEQEPNEKIQALQQTLIDELKKVDSEHKTYDKPAEATPEKAPQ